MEEEEEKDLFVASPVFRNLEGGRRFYGGPTKKKERKKQIK